MLDRIERIRSKAFDDGLNAWAAIHGLAERDKGRYWCGHSLLGRRPRYGHQSECHKENTPPGSHSIWWDHVRGFAAVERHHATLCPDEPLGDAGLRWWRE